ncbi:hypothetical protein [Leptospira interrogans]|uniref:hypothetical protein n=1 Tax=Leptospira interrogans TaxID=173 RepID=UPI0012AE98D2|nr:hypothetical protein [Leptospira interrogans]
MPRSLRIARDNSMPRSLRIARDNSMPRSLRIARDNSMGHVVNSKLFYSGLIEYSNFI